MMVKVLGETSSIHCTPEDGLISLKFTRVVNLLCFKEFDWHVIWKTIKVVYENEFKKIIFIWRLELNIGR
jgi:hypothetical protein